MTYQFVLKSTVAGLLSLGSMGLVFSCQATQASQTVVRTGDIPLAVFNALVDLCHGCGFANSDAKWNPSDVLNELPQRQLVSVDQMGTKWKIVYDIGGIALSRRVVVFELQPSIHLTEGSDCLPATSKSRCSW